MPVFLIGLDKFEKQSYWLSNLYGSRLLFNIFLYCSVNISISPVIIPQIYKMQYCFIHHEVYAMNSYINLAGFVVDMETYFFCTDDTQTIYSYLFVGQQLRLILF